MAQPNTYNIITNWLKRSNIVQVNNDHHKSVPYYHAETSLIQILIEIDSLFESNRDNGGDLAEKFENLYGNWIEGSALEGISDSKSIYSSLQDERNTWKLLIKLREENCLNKARFGEESNLVLLPPQTGIPMPEFSLMQYFFENSLQCSKASTVRTWLEEIAPEFKKVEPRKGGWKFTKQELFAHKRELKPLSKDLINELDPDAPYRLSKQLNGEDERYEMEFLKTLYFLIRRGKIEEAFEVASQSDQPWRAASIKGGLYFNDPLLGIEPSDGMSYEIDREGSYDDDYIDENEEPEAPGGNFNRSLWKSTCYMISNDTKNYVYERALYAVLCGDLDNILNVCETWEDYLWAYYNCMIESKLDSYLKTFPNIELDMLPTPPQIDLDEADFFSNLEQSSDRNVITKASSFCSQLIKHIILNTLESFLEGISCTIKEHGFNNNNKLDTVNIRLLVLIILYLQSIDFISISEVTDNIIKCYIFRLVQIKELRLAIFYCAKLSRHMQLETYTDILTSLEGPLKNRLECLNYGTIHGLNHDNLLVYTAQKCLEKSGAFEPIPDNLNYEEFDFCTVVKKVNDNITKQIRSFEWITSDPSLYSEAIVLCNQLCRKYMISGKLWAADLLLKSMPKNFVLPEWKAEADVDLNIDIPKYLSSAAQEHMNYNICIEAFRQLDSWNLIMKRKPKNHGREIKEWESEAKAATFATEHALRYALNSDWMLNCFPDSPSSSMHFGSLDVNVKEEIIVLRQVYIPEMVFSLYRILAGTRDIIPGNYFRCFEMCELVAGEKLGIYKAVMNRSISHNKTRNDLPTLMDLFSEAGIEYLKYTDRAGQENKLLPDLEREVEDEML